jgi:hypothetical protein
MADTVSRRQSRQGHLQFTLGSTSLRFTPKDTSNYHLPATGIPYPSAQVAPHGKTRPRLVVYSNLVDTTLTLHTPKSHM